MPTEPVSLDSSSPDIEILLASNIADDDLLWVARCTVGEFHRLLAAPVAWVSALGDLPDWNDAQSGRPAPRPSLLPDFTMRVEADDPTGPDGTVVVQGISGTNYLKAIASRAALVRSLLLSPGVDGATASALGLTVPQALSLPDRVLAGAPASAFAPFWLDTAHEPNDSGAQKTLLVEVLPEIGRCFAHFEILDPWEEPDARARRAANFLLGTAFDAEGEMAMLSALPQRTLYVERGVGRPGPALAFRAATSQAAVFANVEVATSADNPSQPPSPPTFCTALDGTVYQDGVSVGGQTVKRYGVDPTVPTAETQKVVQS